MPFDGDNAEDVFDKIRKCDYELPNVRELSPECVDLLASMLTLSPKKRTTAK